MTSQKIKIEQYNYSVPSLDFKWPTFDKEVIVLGNKLES